MGRQQALDLIFEKLNAALKNFYNNRDQKSASQRLFTEKDKINEKSAEDAFYLEKLHVWESQHIQKQIFVLVHGTTMFFFYMFKEIFYIKPLCILKDVKQLIACDMNLSEDHKVDLLSAREDLSDAQSHQYRFIQIELTEQGRASHKRGKSHIVLIQHNSDNIERLANFINYQRLDNNLRGIQLINQTFDEQTSHQERNTYKAFTFSMINFDPYKQITKDNETILRRRERAPAIYSEIFLTEKSSYFMMRTQIVNCLCQLKEPSQQAIELVEQTILMFEQSEVDSEETERLLKQRIRKLIVEEQGEDFTADYRFDAPSLQAITNKLMRLFCYVLQLKIGPEEITKDRVTERLIINSSMRVTTHSNIRNGTWFMDIRVSLDQYHAVQDWKGLFGSTSRQSLLADHLELPNSFLGQPLNE